MSMPRPVLIALLLACAGSVSAAKPRQPPPDPTADPLMVQAGFLAHHPDLDNRLKGWKLHQQGKYPQALEALKRAAFYADKPSQGLIAEMYFQGVGTDRDPALAYAWMDLAAERGWKTMLIQREKYWQALDAAQQADAIARGQALYARYGDDVAKPRLERILRRARMQVTGSRTGFVGALTIVLSTEAGEITLDGSQFYHPRYWKPEAYWAWQEEVWRDAKPGRVNVGEVEVVKPPSPAPAKPRP